jgi:hypothetical protein
MPVHEMTIQELEKLSADRLTTAFPMLLSTINKVADFGGEVLHAQQEVDISDVTHADAACRNLFSRLLTDVYAVWTLALRGYSLQATSLASSSFETAFMVMYIGANDVRAKEWLDNPSAFDFAVRVKPSIREVLADQGFKDAALESETDRIYTMYKQLCSVKHANVHIQGQFQFRRQEMDGEQVIRVECGPDAEPRSTWLAAWCLQQLSVLVIEASSAYFLAHTPTECHAHLHEQAQKIRTEVNNLTPILESFRTNPTGL